MIDICKNDIRVDNESFNYVTDEEYVTLKSIGRKIKERRLLGQKVRDSDETTGKEYLHR